jgi:hypothetical protein
MAVYDEVLPATRSCTHRTVRWTPHPAAAGCPCCGTLEVARGRKVTSYAVTEINPDPGFGCGRAFQLTKADGTVYSLFLGAGEVICDCPGKCYAASERADRRHGRPSPTSGCCHLDAVATLIQRGWLPDPRGNGEADVACSEVA